MKSNGRSRESGTSDGSETSEVQDSSVLGSDLLKEPKEDPGKKERSIQLMPVYTASPARPTRGPGRPYATSRRPSPSDLEYHTMMAREREAFVGMDPVVHAIDDGLDSAALLRTVKREVATEAASLHFQRLESEKLGRDTSHVSYRRIDALTRIANIELDIRKIGADTIDLKGEKFQKIFKYLINAFRTGCVDIGMAPEQIDILFNHLSTSLEGWEDKVLDQVR